MTNLKRRTPRAFLWVLLLSLWPGGLELVEDVSHLLVYGDVAHHVSHAGDPASEHAEDPGPSPEHGCSGLVHHCACCAQPQLVVAAAAPLAPFAEVCRWEACATPAPPSLVLPPPRRPPRA